MPNTSSMSVNSNNDKNTILHIDLPANADEYEMSIERTQFLSLDSLGSLTADTIHVYITSSSDPSAGEWDTVKMSDDTEPFTARNNNITGIDVRSQAKIKVVRDGGADGTGVGISIGLS